jgi:hypothetical protein
MPDTGFLALSAVCLVAAVLFVLYPDALLKLNGVLNRTLVVMDHSLARHRYVVAVALFVVSYLLFRLALMVPSFRA